MPDGKGGTIAPTGMAFAIDMVTVGIWNARHDGRGVLLLGRPDLYTKMGLG
jgi:hypothetical protein